MAQTPNVIGTTVMQLLKERGEPATPENYERTYYEISGLPQPAKPSAAEAGGDKPQCGDLIVMLRQMLEEITDKTGHLARDLGEKNQGLSENVNCLKSSRDKNEILRLLTTVVTQAGSIHNTVESSHQELLETRLSLTTMQEELAETRQLLNEDALTGALNRRGLDATLSRDVARAQRLNARFTLAMLDLDHFKKINDLHGHEAGDLMLMHFTSLVRSVMRKSDALVRYGGEEFVLLLPETDARGAHFVLGRLQQVMVRTPLNYAGKQINTTFSAGIACLKADENGHALLRRADEAVYAAKNAGRNAIKLAQ
jgi:diguanylate cyclase